MFSLFSFFKKNRLEIYTDGSHKNRWGSWSFVVLNNKKVIYESYGRLRKTDSLQMEFFAAIQALKYLPQNSKCSLFSDSKILIETMNTKISTWKRQNWLSHNNKDIPNIDLIRQLDELNQLHVIKWVWVKAHSGNVYNERCDHLCTQARENSNFSN